MIIRRIEYETLNKLIKTQNETIKTQNETIKAQNVVIESLKRTCSLQVQISNLGGRLTNDW